MPSQQPHELAALLAEGRQLAKRRPSSGQNRIAAASAEGRAPSAPTEGRPPPAPPPETRPSVRAPEEPVPAPAAVARPVPTAPAPVAEPVAEGPSGGGRGRPTPTLQPTWIDPEETPFVPVPRPGKALPSRLFSLVVALGLVALLAWLILPEVSFRIGHAHTVRVSDGVLSAQPVQLAPTEAATVEELLVDPRRLPDAALPAGTPVARLKVSTPDAFGSDTQELSVPFDARFVSIDTLPGGVTQPGTPVATVYDPGQMEVIMTVSAEVLDSLRRGMRATLSSGLLESSVEGTVTSAVPLLGTDHEPSSNKLVNIRIQPDDGPVTDLVPGIRFDATIDLDSAPEDAPPLAVSATGSAPAPDDGPTASPSGGG